MLENNNYMFPVLSELYKAPLHFTPSCSQVLHCVHIHASSDWTPTKQIWIHMISSETDLQQHHQVYLTSDGSKQLLLNNHQCMLGRLTVTWPDRAESCRRLLIWKHSILSACKHDLKLTYSKDNNHSCSRWCKNTEAWVIMRPRTKIEPYLIMQLGADW